MLGPIEEGTGAVDERPACMGILVGSGDAQK